MSNGRPWTAALKVLAIVSDYVVVIIAWSCIGVGFGWWDWWVAPKNESAIVIGLLLMLGGQITRQHRDRHDP